MDSLDIAEYNTETSDKKQEVTMTVHLDNKDYPILTLCAYQYDGENCLVMLNDTTLGFAKRSLVVDLQEAINAANLAQLLSTMFNLEPRHGQKSEFGGAYFECMKAPFPGKNGHIAMRTPDLTAAMEELKEKGFTFNMDTAAYFEDGRIKNVYLNGEYGGFAIHIMQK